MILVDVQVPAVGQSFDFELDEEMNVGIAIEEVSALIAQKEDLKLCDGQKMYFYAPDKELILREEFSLKQQGILGGEKLLMI